jgi:hypothetical protein
VPAGDRGAQDPGRREAKKQTHRKLWEGTLAVRVLKRRVSGWNCWAQSKEPGTPTVSSRSRARGQCTLFIGDDINDAGGLYLRHGQGFTPLVTNGISGTSVPAHNLRGTVGIGGKDTEAEVKLPTPEADDAYFVTCSVSGGRGKPAAGARRVWVGDKTKQGFRVRCEEAPGGDSSVTVDWILVR